MNVKISDETGLPELPDGYYWRVLGHAVDRQTLTVVLLKRRRWWRDKFVDRGTADCRWANGFGVGPKDAVRIAASRVYNRQRERISSEMTAHEKAVASLVGDYPPKRLP